MVIKLRNILVLFCFSLTGVVSAAPDIQHWVSEKGARVYFVPANDLPVIDLRLVFDAGSARDDGNYGVALLTNGLMSEGAAGNNAQQLAEQFEAVGAQFSNGALKDMAWLNLRSLSDAQYLKPALAALDKILTRPDFPAPAFKREIERLKISVQGNQQSPSAIAEEAFYKALYGDHPYAMPTEGTEKSLAKIKVADLRVFYKKYYTVKNAVISIVGDLTRQQAENMINDLLSDLPVGQRAEKVSDVKPLTESKTIEIDFPSSQSHILIGQLGTSRGDDDYYSLYVANHPFGGSGFASRLVDEVREKRGLAYSVYSYFLPMRLPGPFQMGLQTRNDQAEQALQIINSELKRYIDEGPTKEELEASLTNITGGFPLRIDSNRKLVEYLAMIGFYDLPLTYLQEFNDKIRAIDIHKIRDALVRRIHPDKMITVIVGKQASKS
ncbi:MAG: insulinase family protein [Gammaproteobacteria bacterium]|nr:insulinase family protein [Gammaproteobacteria bacterium]MDH5735579.1 insulinase family protein [Gammaproteobacteria bacterium]